MFYLDLLDNLPRLRLSDDQMKTVLWIMKKCDTPNVPSLKGLRKRQAAIGNGILTPKLHTSVLGNQFHMNHPVDLLKLVSYQKSGTGNNDTDEKIRIGPTLMCGTKSKYIPN